MEKKFWLQVIGLLILIFGGLALTFKPNILSGLGFSFKPISVAPVAQSRVAIIDSSVSESTNSAKAIFNVEIADTAQKRKMGLGGRDSLALDSGMLFVLDNTSKPNFWMKGMKFPIDIIWIRDNVIVDILPNVPPPAPNQADSSLTLYAPTTEVNRVLEINAGELAKYGIKVGDKLQLIQASP